jgi:polysaccharide biosynthesis transport protein
MGVDRTGTMTEHADITTERDVAARRPVFARAAFKRMFAVVAAPIAAGLIAFGVVTALPDVYTASALIQIDPRLKPAEAQGAAAQPALAAFEAERLSMEAEIALLRSPVLRDSVIHALKLSEDPEFASPSASQRFLSMLGASPADVADAAFDNALSVERVHGSSMIKVRFTSRDGMKAARIANALANAYVTRKLPGSEDATIDTPPSETERAFSELLARYDLRAELPAGRVVDEARPPRQPAGPKRARIVTLAAASALALALLIAWVLQRGASSPRSRSVEKALSCSHMTSLPVTATGGEAEDVMRSARLVVMEPHCPYAEAVRSAARELETRRSEGASRTILVVSAVAGEGAETFASNLAHQLAVAGDAAILIDCDFHDKALTRRLTPFIRQGFFDQIGKRAPVENVILRCGVTGVHFLPAAGTAPAGMAVASLLRSREFSTAIAALKARFATIVAIAPPLLSQSDARTLAELADDVVFVTAWHRTPRVLAKRALALLDANQHKLAGAVLSEIADSDEEGAMRFSTLIEELRRATGFGTRRAA